MEKAEESTLLRYKEDDYEFLDGKSIAELKKEYKDLEAKEAEILEAVTDDKVKKLPPADYGLRVNQYITMENYKLIIVDRIIKALRKNAGCEYSDHVEFSKVNLTLKGRRSTDDC